MVADFHLHERLVEVTTADGLLLDGVVISPAGAAPEIDAAEGCQGTVVWIHGWSRSFLAPTPLRVGRALAARGVRFVGANTRGAGYGAPLRTARGWASKLGGGVWELFSESPLDIDAWLSYAANLASGPVVLLGHSLGGLKALYFQAHAADSRVLGLCLASPPVRPHRPDRELVAFSRRLVAEGRGAEIVFWDGAEPGLSAQSFLDRALIDLDLFGFETEAPAIGRVRCPVLAIYGETEQGAVAAVERIRTSASAASRVDVHLLAGADHAYTGHEDAVAVLVAGWVESLGT